MLTPHHSQVGTQRSLGWRAAGLGIIANGALVALKAVIGVIGQSHALVADAVHSGGDLLNSVIAMGSLLYASRPPDWNHPYGHERAEAFASTIAAVLISMAGLAVAAESVQALAQGDTATPSALTLWAAGTALAVKLILSGYVGGQARALRSKALRTEARDHLLDVVASLVVIAGITAARLGWRGFDAIAGLGVAAFILVTAFAVLRDAAQELMDTSLSPTQRHAILAVAESVPGVQRVRAVAGRTIGHAILVELHVDVDPALSVADGAHVTDAIKELVLLQIPDVRTVVVELNTDQFEPEALRMMAPPDRS